MDRIISAWIQNRSDCGDDVPPTLDRAVQEMPERFVGQSRYWHNIRPYQELFAADQIFVGFMEDLNRDPESFFRSLSAFLDIPCTYKAERGHLNKSDGKRVPTSAYTTINRFPLTGLAKSVLPKGIKTFVKQRLLSRQVTERPGFSPAVQAALLDSLRPDAEAFLTHYGKPRDFWSLA